jgi:tRNA 2-selenouridine synthase
MLHWQDRELTDLFLNSTPLIDVRAPIEFASGSIPYSVNLPILTDDERVLVGTTYKEKGQEAAIKLGHQLVSGENKENKIRAWVDYIKAHPEAQIFCARGGMRSGITCEWLKDQGIKREPIRGGYKRIRNFFLSLLNDSPLEFIRLGGATGSGKSVLLQEFLNVDLEALANHRGSAFGGMGSQPAQASFENNLALQILKTRGKRFLLEDESATIGKIVIPARIFQAMRESKLVVLEASVEERAERIFEQYVRTQSKEFFFQGIEKIKKSLGGVDFERVKSLLEEAFSKELEFSSHQDWIRFLLVRYYDPIYARALIKQKEKILFRGNMNEVRDFLLKNL